MNNEIRKRLKWVRLYEQTQNAGLKLWLGPKWFFEGMAYSLSEDPRSKLPAPFEQYRSQFGTWYHTMDKKQIWLEASKL